MQRKGLVVVGKSAVLAAVDPPLTGNGWSNGTSQVILISRSRAAESIDDILADPGLRPARVFVCRYLGDPSHMPAELPRSAVSVEFWGLLQDAEDH